MADDRLSRVEELFRRAIALPPARWPAFLAETCGDDPATREAVEDLLADWAEAAPSGTHPEVEDTFLQGPVLAARTSALGQPVGIPGYRIVRPIGSGGMGTVYEAEQENPRRRVAVKVIRPEMMSAELDRRFRLEAQVLGHLRHPGIAQIFEAGRTDAGLPFIAMEFVAGLPLNEYLRANPLPAAGRIDILARVCDAMHHAHAQGVIHRDLKPANILVDDTGRPRVLDFGVARAAGLTTPTVGTHTQSGQLLGTLAYMSPEQMAAEPDAIDERTDVYSLGVILYELLADRPPFDIQNLPLPEVARVICEREPAKLGAIDPRLRGDLETIAAKAMEKDANRRYRSALDLADELRRYVSGESIHARPISGAERLSRWCRRHPRQATMTGVAATALLLLGVGGVVAGVVFARQAEQQRELATNAETARRRAEEERTNAELAQDQARAEAERATAVTTFLKGMFEPEERLLFGAFSLGIRDPSRNDGDILRRGVEKLSKGDGFHDRPLVRAELLHDIGTAYLGRGQPKEAAPLLDEALALRRRHLPPTHPDLGRSVFAVAQVRSLFLDEADDELFREAITICRANPDPDGLNLADVEAVFAVYTWYLNNNNATAKPMLLRAHEAYSRAFGDTDARTLSTLLALVNLNVTAEEYGEAIPRIKLLTVGLERGTTHPDVLACIRQMLTTYVTKSVRGDAAAIEPARKLGDQFARTFGEHHYFTLHARSLLADIVPDLQERIRLWRSCLKSLDTWGVPSTFLRAKFTFDIARATFDQAAYEKELRAAIVLFRQLAPKQSQGRAEYPYAIQRLAHLLTTRDDAKSRTEVGELLEEGRAYCKTNPRVLAYRRAFAFMDAGHWRLQHGDTATSVEYFDDAIALWRKDTRPEVRKHLAEALALRAYALRQRGEVRQADEAAGEVRNILDALKDTTSPNVVTARKLLAGQLPNW